MKYLTQFDLSGGGLVKIDNPMLVSRYNTALQEMCLQTTKLTSFQIDGMGWSPEIAEELDDFFYLSHSETSNPFAIILTPKQQNKPLYAMHHSFDLDMFNVIFKQYLKQIEDITTQEAVWFMIDNGIEFYDSPSSLLLVNSIHINFTTTNDLMENAFLQKELIKKYYKDDFAWKDSDLLKTILDSVNQNGDMRQRHIIMYPIQYNHFTSYYTRSFNGVFIIREEEIHEKPIIICEDEKWKQVNSQMYDSESDLPYMLFSANEKAKQYLEQKNMLYISEEYWKKNIDRLQIMKEYLMIKSLAINGASLSKVKKVIGSDVEYVAALAELRKKNKLDIKYDELDKFIQYLTNPKIGKRFKLDVISDMLLIPNEDLLSQQSQLMFWRFLARIRKEDILMNYTVDKEYFFKVNKYWHKETKYWVADKLSKKYVSKNYQKPIEQ